MSVATGSVAVQVVEVPDGFVATCNAVGLKAFGRSVEVALLRLKERLDASHPSLRVTLLSTRNPQRFSPPPERLSTGLSLVESGTNNRL